MRRMILDWRGSPDLSKPADFYSVGATARARPALGNPKGRVLVAMSSTLLCDPAGVPSSTPFNVDLYRAIMDCKAMTTREVWRNPDSGWHTILFDLTQRGMVTRALELIEKYFPWADGIHWDYASAWSWQFKDMEPTDDAWDRTYNGLFNAIRAKGKLVLAQQWHQTAATTGASGEFFEQSPTSFGQTLDTHTKEIMSFRDLVKRVDGRETLFVSELREYLKFPAWYVNGLRAWAEQYDVVLSFGRDAQAVLA